MEVVGARKFGGGSRCLVPGVVIATNATVVAALRIQRMAHLDDGHGAIAARSCEEINAADVEGRPLHVSDQDPRREG